MAEKDGDLMEQYCSTKDFVRDKNYRRNVNQRVVEIMSEYEYYIDYSVFGMNIVNEIEDELLLKFKIISEFIKEKGEIVDKNNKEQLYFLLGEEEYRGNWGRGVDVKVFLKSFLDKHQTISSMLCIFLKVISVFPPYSSSRSDVIKRLSNLLKDFYKIEEDKNAEYGYRVIPKHNTEIIQAVENEPSLQTVMKYYYQNDIKKALGELRKLYEKDGFENFVKQSNNEIKFIYHFVYKIISIIDVHPSGKGKSEERIKSEFEKYTKELQNLLSRVNGSNNVTDIKTLNDLQVNCGYMFNNMIDQKNLQLQYKDFNETEVRIWFDLGLSIYRLFTIYGD